MPAENVILCDTKGVDLQGPERGHEPVEVGARRRDERAHARRGACAAPTSSSASPSKGAITREMIASMAAKPIIFAMANPDPEITAGGSRRDPRRRHHGDRPLRLPEPGQQRPRLPLHLPRRARRPRDDDQRRDEDRRRRSARRAGPRGRAGRGGRGLSGQPAALRTALHHPGPVRSAPHLRHPAGGGPGGDGQRRRATARSPTWRPIASQLSARRDPDRRHAAADHRARPSPPAARGLRRGRGGDR